jgi:hypothetical protein
LYPDMLFIPVHNGGDYLAHALESLLPILDNFPQVVISLNSENNGPDKACISRFLGDQRPNVVVMETPRVYSAVGHLKWAFSSQLQRNPAKTLMLFFHDDRLDAASFDDFASSQSIAPDSAIFGGWRQSRDGAEFGAVHLGVNPEGESPTDWFTREDLSKVHLHEYTNASGLVIPMASMRAFTGWVPLTRGARFEHMLVSHRSVKVLRTVPNPYLIVSRHDGQEGANIPLLQGLTDEIVFQFWMIWNLRRKSPRALVHGLTQLLLAGASLLRQSYRRLI